MRSNFKVDYDNALYDIKPDQRLFAGQDGQLKESTVYLVDDDYDDRLYAYSRLVKSDYVTTVCPVTGADALFTYLENVGVYDSAFLAYNPSLILLDLHMPGTTGLEALGRLRNHPVTKDMPVVLLTSDIACENVYDAYRLYANGYLQKPLDMDAFHEVVETGWNWIRDGEQPTQI